MAYGLPEVASSIGINKTIIDNGDNGFIPKSDTE